jgi:hypothetical protein
MQKERKKEKNKERALWLKIFCNRFLGVGYSIL